MVGNEVGTLGQVMQPALIVLANCVMVPPSLAHLLPPPDRLPARKKAAKPSEKVAALTSPQPQPDDSHMDLELQPSSSVEVRSFRKKKVLTHCIQRSQQTHIVLVIECGTVNTPQLMC
jgi:hypothetical protein